MGEDKAVFNLDQCEVVRGYRYGYKELELIGRGVADLTR